jgi:hypothetical protein
VTELEQELIQLEAAIAAGTLTEEEATEAKVRIVTRLEVINTSIDSSSKGQLTDEQRLQLASGLLRLKDMLVAYQDTLTTIDAQADDTEVSSRLRTRSINNTGSKRLTEQVADTIEAVEETAEEVIEDYIPDAELDAQIEEIVSGDAELDSAVETNEETEVETPTDEGTVEMESESEIEATPESETSEETMEEETTTDDETAEMESESDISVEGEVEINP